jgi:hypothetical protein
MADMAIYVFHNTQSNITFIEKYFCNIKPDVSIENITHFIGMGLPFTNVKIPVTVTF